MILYDKIQESRSMIHKLGPMFCDVYLATAITNNYSLQKKEYSSRSSIHVVTGAAFPDVPSQMRRIKHVRYYSVVASIFDLQARTGHNGQSLSYKAVLAIPGNSSSLVRGASSEVWFLRMTSWRQYLDSIE
jgi:hypothetical protein